jgi:hypothetical protein|tara:strand:- start:105 stop:491 length:387 start_codon:yes stop_codon:yes gene_type:complete
MAKVGANTGWHENYVETVTASQTLSYNDSGKVFLVGTDALTVTLPATKAGVRYTFVNSGADGAVLITVSPNSNDKVMGTIAAVSMTASDDGDLTNTKVTANKGDWATIVGDGSDGWYIIGGDGVWAGA